MPYKKLRPGRLLLTVKDEKTGQAGFDNYRHETYLRLRLHRCLVDAASAGNAEVALVVIHVMNRLHAFTHLHHTLLFVVQAGGYSGACEYQQRQCNANQSICNRKSVHKIECRNVVKATKISFIEK